MKNLGGGNNIFHILPFIKYFKYFVEVMAREDSFIKGNFMQSKGESRLLVNLMKKLEWMTFTEEDVIELLKSKNDRGKLPLEQVVLSGDEKLYSALLDTIKRGFNLENRSDLEVVKPDFRFLNKVLISSVENGLSVAVHECLGLLRGEQGDKVTEIVKAALDKAIELNKNEVVLILARYLAEEGKSKILKKLLRNSKKSDNVYLISLLNELKNPERKNLSSQAIYLDNFDYEISKLEDTEGDYDRNILHYAVIFGNEALVDSILKKVGNLGVEKYCEVLGEKDLEGKTVFHLCFEYSCLSILRKLLDHSMKKVGGKSSLIEAIDKKGNTPLHYLKNVRFLEETKRILGKKKFTKVCNCRNGMGRNVLMKYVGDLASINNDSKEVVNLLLGGYNYRLRDERGKSLEMLMIEKDDDFFFDHLYEILNVKGGDKAQKDDIGNNLLHYAAEYSRKGSCLKLFDYHRLDEEKNEDGLNASDLGINKGNTKVLKLILEKDREMGGEKSFEEKAKEMMSKSRNNKQQSVVAMLKDMGVTDKQMGMKRSSSTGICFENENTEMTTEGQGLSSKMLIDKINEYENRFLLDSDFKLNIKFEKATKNNIKEVISHVANNYLGKKGLKNGKGREIIFALLVRSLLKEKNSILESLIEKKVVKQRILNYVSEELGVTLLGIACYLGKIEIVNLLIKKGAEVDVVMEDGNRALMLASQCGHNEICKLLIKNKADVDASDEGGFRALMYAAGNGHKKVCQLLLEKGVDIDAESITGWRSLMYAAGNGHKEICQLLLERGAEVDASENDGWKTLMYAACNGYKEVCELLIERGADVNAERANGWRALMYAASNGYKEICELLIEKGAEIEAGKNNGCTALMLGASNRHKKVCELLLERGANVNSEKNNGSTALIIAAINGYKELCELFLSNGAEVDKKMKNGWSALMLAAQNGHKIVCQLLIERGAKVNVSNNNGISSLMYAAGNGHKEVCELLLKRGAKVDEVDEEEFTALMLAAEGGHREVCELLLKKGAKLGALNKDRESPLMIAAKYGYREVCHLFIKEGAELESLNKDGESPLMIAAKCGYREVCELLLEEGAKLGNRDRRKSLLVLAAKHGHKEVCELMLEKGLEVDEADEGGFRALMFASEGGYKRLCEFLIEKGAEIEAASKEGVRALMLAAGEGYKEVCELLIEKGAEIEASNKDGENSLMIAAKHGHKEVCEFLIEMGAKVESLNKNRENSLMIAAKHGHKEVCEFLIEMGAELELLNKDGENSLMLAKKNEHKEVCELLIEMGAEVDNREGSWGSGVALISGGYEGNCGLL